LLAESCTIRKTLLERKLLWEKANPNGLNVLAEKATATDC
jgi:hypothetical protein